MGMKWSCEICGDHRSHYITTINFLGMKKIKKRHFWKTFWDMYGRFDEKIEICDDCYNDMSKWINKKIKDKSND